MEFLSRSWSLQASKFQDEDPTPFASHLVMEQILTQSVSTILNICTYIMYSTEQIQNGL